VGVGVLVSGLFLATGVLAAETPFGLYKSPDHGATWLKVGQGLPPDVRINALVMAGDKGDRVVAGTDRGIFLSRDDGANWQPIQQSVGTESRVLCLASQGERVFAGTYQHGMLVSEDLGTTWRTVNHGLTDLYVRSVLSVGTKLYAGTDSQGIFVSENAGASWTSQRKGLPDSAQVFDLATVNGTIFAGLYSKGLYRWKAERELWSKSGGVRPLEIVAAGKALVVGHNPGGVFVSEDLGESWADGNLGLPVNAPTWTLAADEEWVWLGTSGKVGLSQHDIGLFASRDRGKSWTRSDAGLPASCAAISFVVTKQFMLVEVSSPAR
jgi:photosystem II stability/assembly factor-like uncharacterized protein